MLLGKEIEKQTSCNSYGLMKIWSNFDHSKVHNYQVVKVKERIFYTSVSSHPTPHTLNHYKKFEMKINTNLSNL
jgi:hypothetical protein